MKEWSKHDKTDLDEDIVFIAASLHRIYPHLNRSIRSRVEGYRGFVNQYILQAIQQIERASKTEAHDLLFLHILSIASSFPPIGIQPSPSTEARRTLMRYVVYLHSQRSFFSHSSFEVEYLISRCVYGLHRQLQDQDLLVFPKQLLTTPISSSAIHQSGKDRNGDGVDWQICVVDSLGKAITHLDVMCWMNQTALQLSLDEDCYRMEISSSIHKDIEKMDNPLHVVVLKHNTTVLYETDVIFSKQSYKSTPSLKLVGMTIVVGLVILSMLYYKNTVGYHSE